MRNELNHCRGFQRSERENTFRCKIVILRGSEIVNREIEICVNTTEKKFSSYRPSVCLISTNQKGKVKSFVTK